MKLNLRNPSPALGLAALGLAAAHPAAAQSIYNFEVTTTNGGAASTTLYSGQGALGAGGTVFNKATSGVSSFTSPAAVDSNGAASSVTLSVAAPGNSFTYSAAPSSAYTATSPAQLFAQYDYINGGTANFALANLTASTPYTLYLYGADNYSEHSTFTVSGGTAVNPGGGAATSSTTGSNNNIAFGYGTNYVVFTGVTDASGGISGTVGAQDPFNGLQVELNPVAAAPEPSQAAVLVLGMLGVGGLALRARKRNATSLA